MYKQGLTVIIKKGKHESIVDSFCPPLRIASELLSLNFYPVNTPRLFLTYFKKKTLIEFHFKILLHFFTEIHQPPALSGVSTGPCFIPKWICICLRAIDTAADPQKDGRDDAREHLIEGGHKRAPTTGLHTYRNIRESSFKCLLNR